jgi:hypothetical protein
MEKLTKTQQAQAAAIEAVIAAGFVDDGETRSQTVRMESASNPIYGGIGGRVTTIGGRPRFALPGTDRKVTVGPRSVCFYRFAKGDREPHSYQSFATKDVEAIRHAANILVGCAA